ADANCGGAGFSLHADEVLDCGFAHGANKRIGSFSLNDRQFGKARDQAKVAGFKQCFADRGAISEIAAGNDDVVGGLPVKLLEQFKGESFLAFEAERIDRVELVDRSFANKFLQKFQAAIEVGAQLAGNSTIVESLRKFAPGNLAVGNQ